MGTRDFSGREVVKVLTKNRFHVVDRTGSHVKLRYEHPTNEDDIRVVSVGSSLLTDDARPSSMSLTAEDFERYLRSDDDGEPLGDALAVLALEVETDAVADVRAIREHE